MAMPELCRPVALFLGLTGCRFSEAVIVDLRPLIASPGARFAAGETAVNAAAARAFVWVCGEEELTAVD